MTDRPVKPKPALKPKGSERQMRRKERQSEQLRENLLKRKAQMRARSEDDKA